MNKFILTLYFDPSVQDPDTFNEPYDDYYSVETELSLDLFKDFLVNLHKISESEMKLGQHKIIKDELSEDGWFTVETLDDWWNKGLIKI